MKRLVVALAVAGAVLSGCAASDEEKAEDLDGRYKTPFTLTTESGGKVECYMIGYDNKGGPTCDWVGYHNRVDRQP